MVCFVAQAEESRIRWNTTAGLPIRLLAKHTIIKEGSMAYKNILKKCNECNCHFWGRPKQKFCSRDCHHKNMSFGLTKKEYLKKYRVSHRNYFKNYHQAYHQKIKDKEPYKKRIKYYHQSFIYKTYQQTFKLKNKNKINMKARGKMWFMRNCKLKWRDVPQEVLEILQKFYRIKEVINNDKRQRNECP